MSQYINEHGKLVLTGADAIRGWLETTRQLRENRKLHYKTTFQDIPISVENRVGSVRRGTDPDGEEWKTKMKVPYGYIPGTKGADGDALDIFVGSDDDAAYAYVIHSNDPESGDFDEDKVMLGFSSKDSAVRCFKQHYDDDKFFGGVDEIPMWKFRDRAFVKKYTTKKLVASKREASLQVPEDYFATEAYQHGDQAGRDTDQIMKKSILGHHQDQMTNPQVREHGVKGQQWGVKKPDLEHDPRTASMMQVIKRNQPQMNAIKQWQKNRAAKLLQQGQKPPGKNQLHAEALQHLKSLGWHAISAGARLAGLGGLVDSIGTLMQHSSGARAMLKTNDKGNHSMKPVGERQRAPKQDDDKKQQWKPAQQGAERAAGISTLNKYLDYKDNPRIPALSDSGRSMFAAAARQIAQTGQVTNELARTFERSKEPLMQAAYNHAIYKYNPNHAGRESVRESIRRIDNFGRRLRETTYYARSMGQYGTDRESDDLDSIREAFGGGVNSPQTKRHADLGMGYFHKKIDAAKRVVIRPARKNRITAGVFSEAKHALKNKIPVYAIREGKFRRVKSVEALDNPNNQGHFGKLIFKKKRRT